MYVCTCTYVYWFDLLIEYGTSLKLKSVCKLQVESSLKTNLHCILVDLRGNVCFNFNTQALQHQHTCSNAIKQG